MIAYNLKDLDNHNLRQSINEAAADMLITQEEKSTLLSGLPEKLYSPNFFIRIGLFLLTLIIQCFSFGLITLVSLNEIEHMLGGLAIFFSVLCYFALELLIKRKHHYHSGVDDSLLWGASVALFSGIVFPHTLSNTFICAVALMICIFGFLRYAYGLMAVLAFLSLLGIIISSAVGTRALPFMPFILMIISGIMYWISKKAGKQKTYFHYRECFLLLEITALLCLYGAGNYFVVREYGSALMNGSLQQGQSLSFGGVFWIFTAVIPFVYLVFGIKSKDPILIRVGLILMAAIVFTVRYYHTIFPAEILMTISGISLLAIAYALIRYLRRPRFGFTSNHISAKNKNDELNIEALILAQTFKPGMGAHDKSFGGGSFGGGGASGEY